jgi:molybdopterin molybdotransferase
LLPFEEAQRRVVGLARRLDGERIVVSQAAGRVLHSEVRTTTPIPAFDASTMDGYAVRVADVGDEPLTVSFEVRAGAAAPDLASGTACRIFTGAPLPRGADAVVMQEDTTRDGERVRLHRKPVPGAFIRRAGDDLAPGDVALPRGRRIGAREIAMLSSLDQPRVEVTRSPRVVVLPTGDELRAAGEPGSAASIPESNAAAIAAMAVRGGASAVVRSPLGDDEARVRAGVAAALGTCDVLVTIGGVSVGDHDVVRGALQASGVSLEFWRVAIKPGKPLAVGRAADVVVLGLPGNPVSALVTFALFGLPLLRAMQGDERPLPRRSKMKLAEPVLRSPSDRLELARARADGDGVRVLPQQASGALIGLCLADVLACIPPHTTMLDAGQSLDVYPMGELGL